MTIKPYYLKNTKKRNLKFSIDILISKNENNEYSTGVGVAIGSKFIDQTEFITMSFKEALEEVANYKKLLSSIYPVDTIDFWYRLEDEDDDDEIYMDGNTKTPPFLHLIGNDLKN